MIKCSVQRGRTFVFHRWQYMLVLTATCVSSYIAVNSYFNFDFFFFFMHSGFRGDKYFSENSNWIILGNYLSVGKKMLCSITSNVSRQWLPKAGHPCFGSIPPLPRGGLKCNCKVWNISFTASTVHPILEERLGRMTNFCYCKFWNYLEGGREIKRRLSFAISKQFYERYDSVIDSRYKSNDTPIVG